MKKLLDLRGVLPVNAADLHAYGAIALMAVGAWMVYRPAGFIVAGIVLFYLGAFHGRRK